MARKELTKSKAKEYARATKKHKGKMLDRLCEDTGWSRANGRRQLKIALSVEAVGQSKKAKPKKYSTRSRIMLANVWALSGTPCGQYLHAMIKDGLIARLVANQDLREGPHNKGRVVVQGDGALKEIALMSSATIDRYLKDEKKKLEPLSRASTKKSTYPLRSEIPFGKSYAKIPTPGYLSTDTVAHCGNTMKGDHLWTLNSTDVLTGWSETVTIKNRARSYIIEGHDQILGDFPFDVIAVNYDGGSEFINYEMLDYSIMHNYQMTRSRPYHSNDNAHIEQKNGDIVRRYAFRYRYEDERALNLLNALWYWVNLRKNYLIPCKKCIGHTKTHSGRTRGIYDDPKTPYRRTLESGILSPAKVLELKKRFTQLNDARVTKEIIRLQQELLGLIADKGMLELINETAKDIFAA